MFHCLVIKVVCLSSLCDSPFTLSYLSDLVKHFFQKFFRSSRSCIKLFVSVVLFKRLDYFTISSVICQQLIQIFWKPFYFSVFQKQFLATACLLYHCRKESSSTFYKKNTIKIWLSAKIQYLSAFSRKQTHQFTTYLLPTNEPWYASFPRYAKIWYSTSVLKQEKIE